MIHASGSLLRRLCVVAFLAASLGGCSLFRDFQPSVAVRPIAPEQYIALQRGDILSTRQLSALTLQTIRVTGLDLKECAAQSSSGCLAALADAQGVPDERKLSALAELWLQRAMSTGDPAYGDAAEATPTTPITPWIEAARHAYGYLFFTQRTPGERAFEERQTQVRDWYNYAVQEAVTRLFGAISAQAHGTALAGGTAVRVGDWTVRIRLVARLPEGVAMPQELLPASSLSFQGLRSVYRRDGFGATLVAVTGQRPVGSDRVHGADSAPGVQDSHESGSLPAPWSEMPSPNVTVVFRFEADSLDELLDSRELTVRVHDPLVESRLLVQKQSVPLAGNFTAGYGLWLARSGFSGQSLRTLLGRENGLTQPHVYLLQPYDPNRRIILMLHGLASSPEAWVNMANEILGDEDLRREFQVWLIHYPTNMPVIVNLAAIRRLLQETLHNFDPQGQAAASRGLVVIGHSMGGLIARLMVSSAQQQLWNWALTDPRVDLNRPDPVQSWLDPVLRFEAFPGVTRAIFIATPHRGTAVAGYGPARWLSGLIRLPLTTLETIGDVLQARAVAGSMPDERLLEGVPNSIDNLDERDLFVRAAADLPISARVSYHSIIARADAGGPLEDSDDGLVPYGSSHLAGAASEKIIVHGHSVQETAAAILEVRRILREDVATPHDEPGPGR